MRQPIFPFLGHFVYGGLMPENHLSVSDFVSSMIESKLDLQIATISKDALISRSRSRVVKDFLDHEHCNILLMIDHDIGFDPDDAWTLCKKAWFEQAIIGVPYNFRAFIKGWSGRTWDGRYIECGPDWDRLEDVQYVGGGFVAIPRQIVKAVVEKLDFPAGQVTAENAFYRVQKCKDGDTGDRFFYDCFRPGAFTHAAGIWKGCTEYISEDWAFSERARSLGYKTLAWTKPLLTHHGYAPFVMMETKGKT